MNHTMTKTHIKKIKAKSSIHAAHINKESANNKKQQENEKMPTVQEPTGCRVLGIY